MAQPGHDDGHFPGEKSLWTHEWHPAFYYGPNIQPDEAWLGFVRALSSLHPLNRPVDHQQVLTTEFSSFVSLRQSGPIASV